MFALLLAKGHLNYVACQVDV
eukprot:SAG11_NODE_32222_length_285_cov_1.107527_1_plen_20_part_01